MKTNLVVALCLALPIPVAVASELPDTGQTTCYGFSGVTDCVADASYPRQDGAVSAPMSYTKLDGSGNALDAAALDWACVRDDATGLVWEAKTADGGLQDKGHRYAWLSGDALSNGGKHGGTDDKSMCGESLAWLPCSTEFYVGIVNERGLCGANDWRVPTQVELLTLVHAGKSKPTIDTSFFPNTVSGPYWSATTYATIPSQAWGVHFGYGAAHAEPKGAGNAVRLVRGTWKR